MAEETKVDPVKVAALAQKIVVLLNDESPLTRQRAIQSAMTALGDTTPDPTPPTNRIAKHEGDLATFTNRDEKLKPSDNAQLCAAYHFSLYGNEPFSLEELQEIARDAGLVVPNRLDKTVQKATKGGKKLFQDAGRNSYRPTAAAGIHFAERWQVRPGSSKKEKVKISTNDKC